MQNKSYNFKFITTQKGGWGGRGFLHSWFCASPSFSKHRPNLKFEIPNFIFSFSTVLQLLSMFVLCFFFRSRYSNVADEELVH